MLCTNWKGLHWPRLAKSTQLKLRREGSCLNDLIRFVSLCRLLVTVQGGLTYLNFPTPECPFFSIVMCTVLPSSTYLWELKQVLAHLSVSCCLGWDCILDLLITSVNSPSLSCLVFWGWFVLFWFFIWTLPKMNQYAKCIELQWYQNKF